MGDFDRARTRAIRRRQAATGQSYKSARRAIDRQRRKEEKRTATDSR